MMARTKKHLRYVYSSHLIDGNNEQNAEASLDGLEVDQLSPVGPVRDVTSHVSMNESRYLGEMGLLTS